MSGVGCARARVAVDRRAWMSIEGWTRGAVRVGGGARRAAESHGVSVFLCDSRSTWVFKEKSRTDIHIFGHTRASVRHPEAGRR